MNTPAQTPAEAAQKSAEAAQKSAEAALKSAQAAQTLEPAAQTPEQVFDEFTQTVAHLRQECPWDKEQTHGSLRKHLLEEAYETLEAIDQIEQAQRHGTTEQAAQAGKNLCDELGDLLYQVFFHSLLAQERGDFDISDVIAGINAKLIRRHPHVFGDLEVTSQEELAPHWEAIKKTESDRVSVMDGIPSALPALLYASKVQRKAASLGARPPNAQPALADQNSQDLTAAALGQRLFEIVRQAANQGIDAEAALREAAQSFSHRFQELEIAGADVSDQQHQSYIWQGKPASSA